MIKIIQQNLLKGGNTLLLIKNGEQYAEIKKCFKNLWNEGLY